MSTKFLGLFFLVIFSAPAQEPNSPSSEATEKKGDLIKVHISGEINQPQTLSLPKNTLLKDAIKAARGITPGGTHRRVQVMQAKTSVSADLKKGDNPVLQDGALVLIDSIILSEWPPDQRVAISGTTAVPYAQLKQKLEPNLKGKWVMNSWQGQKTLDLRIGAARQYQTFSIFLLPPERRTIDPKTQKQKLYVISVLPRQPRGTEWEKDKLTQTIIELVESACHD